jgi:hypothetical protein
VPLGEQHLPRMKKADPFSMGQFASELRLHRL